MKKTLSLMLILILILTGCGSAPIDPSPSITPESAPETFDSPESVKEFLISENASYVENDINDGNVSQDLRTDTAVNGQTPYAVVVTCSDSRVPAEHVFHAGLGELFVIRTAGNVIGDYELGSVEYGADHLHTKLVVVLGHTHCGAVGATLEGGAHGYIETITNEIASCLPEGVTAEDAEILNVQNSIAKIRESHIMQELEESGAVQIVGAIYDIETGLVEFL